ncbi:MAG: NAD-dependent epimerase/dehydratase family protein [Planctomycetota bacterium]|nr:MAG: NAD-dependent epimerase/dehydratase family protein [Planctomycetota bacterium]
MNSTYTLLTGATGLVGRYLIRDLLREGQRLALLVRRSRRQTAVERVESILQHWEQDLREPLPRPVVLEGNITEERLGLSSASTAWIAGHCSRVIHNAATLQFHGSDRSREPWSTNLGGTRNTLELCRATGIADLHYVSTAYVCGIRDDLVREDELDTGQSFRNDYERSKFEAEKLVRSADFLDRLTVYRPSVIGGDSRTGYTSTYHGLYLYLRLLSLLVHNVPPGPDGVRHTPIQLPLRGDEPRNLVAVDWVSRVICRLLDTPAAHGGTYHLTPARGVTARDLVEAAYEHFNSRGVEFAGEQAARDEKGPSGFGQAVFENKSIYEAYETSDPQFDRAQLLRFAADIPEPCLGKDAILNYWRFAEADDWGRRREPEPEVPCWIADQLRPSTVEAPSSVSAGSDTPPGGTNGSGTPDSAGPRVFGLDVRGPGGGQWTVRLGDDRHFEVELGLPNAEAEAVQIDARDLAARLQAGGAAASDSQVATEAAGRLLAELVSGAMESSGPTVDTKTAPTVSVDPPDESVLRLE